MKRGYRRALTIAGFDGSGGAGIQADLKTFAALGSYGMSVLTALPVQNTLGVSTIFPVPEMFIEEQLQSIRQDIDVDAVKVGMLHRSDIIERVATALGAYSGVPIVLDPIVMSSNGHPFLTPDALRTLKATLFPLVTVLTPNISEAALLLDREVSSKSEMAAAARDLTQLGPQAVVVKGGHLDQKTCDDCLSIRGREVEWFSSPRIATNNTHGTGCTFSAAIAAFLARGFKLTESISRAKKYLYQAVLAGAHFQIGQGHGPVHHFYSYW